VLKYKLLATISEKEYINKRINKERENEKATIPQLDNLGAIFSCPTQPVGMFLLVMAFESNIHACGEYNPHAGVTVGKTSRPP
jgi:hypothetical protein